MLIRRFSAFFAMMVLVLALSAAGGCQTEGVSLSKYRKDPTPMMEAMAETHEQRLNRYARNRDITLRQIWDDLDAIFLLDSPSRMNRYPVP